MLKFILTLAAALTSLPCFADNCEFIRSQILSKIQAAGISNFILVTTNANTLQNGKIVGSCANGTKKIVYLVSNGALASIPEGLRQSNASSANGQAPTDDILTECKDGSVVIGPDCSVKTDGLERGR